MENYYDVIVIGGGPSGIIAGTTAKKQYPEKSMLMIKENQRDLVPCGIPYIFHDLDDVTKDEMAPGAFKKAGGEVLIDRVVNVDVKTKSIKTKSGKEIKFHKLIFATGSKPLVPTFIKGYDLDGVKYIDKNFNKISELKEITDSVSNIVVVGGGFIGVEVAEQLAKTGKNVSLIEMEEYCLLKAFSKDSAQKADKLIKDSGINVFTGTQAKEIKGENGKVKSVLTNKQDEIPAELVIMSIGYVPNSELAKEAGLEINSQGAIRCDNYLKTSNEDIYAVGDCSQKLGFITGRTDNIMLASTATAEARILGYNLYSIKLKRGFTGTLSVFSTEINNTVFASAGAIEQSAIDSCVDYVIGNFKAVDRHPGSLPDTKELSVKLIVSPEDGAIIGGELCGGKSVGEMINIIGMAIQKQVTVYELVSYQIGTHPLLTTAPTKYVLIKAAEAAIANIRKKK